MTLRTRRTSLAALAAALLLSACVGDGDEPITRVTTPSPGGTLFTRYVALGNSITAGFQSGGINATLQAAAYPALLAAKAGAPYNAPLIAPPGCPRPFVGPLGNGGRLGGPDAQDTCFRINAPQFLNNVAVPGENIGNLLSITGVSALHGIMIGGETQLEIMQRTDPTLVTLWIGNNDALGAAVTGNLAALTPAALFAARADSVAAAIAESDPEDAVIIGVVNPNIIPLVQPGPFLFLVNAAQPGVFGRPVNPNCAPGTPTGNANQVSLAVLGTPATGPGAVTEISCADDAPFVLTPAERTAIATRVGEFNTALQAEATANGWAYLDPNILLLPFLADPNRIRKCQGFATATDLPSFALAVQNTCPSLADPAVGFGSLISLDGVHPSSEAHRIIANALAGVLNARHGLTLSTTN